MHHYQLFGRLDQVRGKKIFTGPTNCMKIINEDSKG